MGLNTAVVILNDFLVEISKIPDLGKSLNYAIQDSKGFDRALLSASGIKIIGSYHSSYYIPVLVGGNTGNFISGCSFEVSKGDAEIELLKNLATKHGFILTKK